MRTPLRFLVTLVIIASACSDQTNPLAPHSSSYSFIETWGKDYSNPIVGPGYGDGTSGSEAGAYNNPTGLALSSNCLLVLDAGNHRIQKFGLNGSISAFSDPSANVNSIGSSGPDEGEFSFPSDIKTDRSGNIFVPDANNFNVQIFAPSGLFIQRLASIRSGYPAGTNTPGGFMKPVAVCLDACANLYVLDQVKGTIDKYTNSAANTWTNATGWGTSGSLADPLFKDGLDMVTDSGRILILTSSGFVTCDPVSQSVTSKPLFGHALNRLSSASGLSISDGWIYVTEGSYVKIFNSSLQPVSYIGGITGEKDGEFESISDVTAVNGKLYVADSGNNRLQIFEIR